MHIIKIYDMKQHMQIKTYLHIFNTFIAHTQQQSSTNR